MLVQLRFSNNFIMSKLKAANVEMPIALSALFLKVIDC